MLRTMLPYLEYIEVHYGCMHTSSLEDAGRAAWAAAGRSADASIDLTARYCNLSLKKHACVTSMLAAWAVLEP